MPNIKPPSAVSVFLVLAPLACIAGDGPWVRYVDPREHAYSIDVPVGWHVTGGIERRSPMQPHSVVRLTSPGGATEMVLGNVDAYTYTPLTELSAKLGFREGSITSPGTDHLRVLNYRTGEQFAESAGRQLFAQRCSHPELVRSRKLPGTQPRPQANGLQQGSTAGEAFFTCDRDGHKLEGYVFSSTDYTMQPGAPGGIWNADNTFAFLTPAGNGNQAGVVLTHIIKSTRVDQKWLAAQLRISAEQAGQALANANAQLDTNAASMRSTFQATSKDAAASQEEMHRLLSGFDEYQTADGERRSVPYATATNWWSNGKGRSIGTQGPNAPGIDYQEMKRVPPGQ